MPASPGSARAFGRDAIITALEMLWLDPSIARGVLRLSRRDQATKVDAAADAEPGKILHEARHGEMARPRRGSVPPLLRQRRFDAAVRHARRRLSRAHRRLATVRALWPNIEAALDWIDALRRSRRRRLRRIRPPNRARASPTRAGRTATTRSSMPTAARRRRRSRSPKCRPTSTAPGARPRHRAPRWRIDARGSAASTARRETLRARFDEAVLRRGARHLCPGARRRQAAVPGAGLERRPCAVRGIACPRARRGGRRER